MWFLQFRMSKPAVFFSPVCITSTVTALDNQRFFNSAKDTGAAETNNNACRNRKQENDQQNKSGISSERGGGG